MYEMYLTKRYDVNPATTATHAPPRPSQAPQPMHLMTQRHRTRLVIKTLVIGAAFGILLALATTARANTLRHPTPTTVVFTTQQLRHAIKSGPRCIHIDNTTNHAYYGRDGNPTGGGFDYTDMGDEHIVWVLHTPAWIAARTETAFAVIFAARHEVPGPIIGWTCKQYTAKQVPA